MKALKWFIVFLVLLSVVIAYGSVRIMWHVLEEVDEAEHAAPTDTQGSL